MPPVDTLSSLIIIDLLTSSGRVPGHLILSREMMMLIPPSLKGGLEVPPRYRCRL